MSTGVLVGVKGKRERRRVCSKLKPFALCRMSLGLKGIPSMTNLLRAFQITQLKVKAMSFQGSKEWKVESSKETEQDFS